MKTLLLCLLLVTLPRTADDLAQARKLFLASYSGKPAAETFYEAMKGASTTPVMQGYRAVSQIMMCQHRRNPLTKLSWFNDGRHQLEAALASEPASTELHYLRYTIQTNIPGLLNYSGNLTEDKMLLLHYTTHAAPQEIKSELYNMVSSYLLRTPHTSDAEKAAVRQAAAK